MPLFPLSSRLSATILRGADFSSSRWSETKIERCTFSGCSFVGANLAEIIPRTRTFDYCRFDDAYLNAFRATGGVAFVRCTMRETTFEAARLPDAVFAHCTSRPYRFQRVRPAGCRLPGSNLEQVRGVASFRGTDARRRQPRYLPRRWCRTLRWWWRRPRSRCAGLEWGRPLAERLPGAAECTAGNGEGNPRLRVRWSRDRTVRSLPSRNWTRSWTRSRLPVTSTPSGSRRPP